MLNQQIINAFRSLILRHGIQSRRVRDSAIGSTVVAKLLHGLTAQDVSLSTIALQ